MKILKLLLALTFAVSLQASAQSNLPQTIKGTLAIDYKTHQVDSIVPGVQDTYTVNINFENSVLFHGTIVDNPQIVSGIFTKSVTQNRSLNYNVACDVVNPRRPDQTKNVGQLKGNVAITTDGTYQYDRGNVEIDMLVGRISTSKFTGPLVGKPLNRPANWYDTLKCQAVSITRSIGGKTTTVVLNKYDKLVFNNHTLAGGPIGDDVKTTGELYYDYEKKCWFFNSFKLEYPGELILTNGTAYLTNAITKNDRITGTIRWLPSPHRLDDGHGEYQFDIRVNEPIAPVSAAFDNKPTDVSSFFDTDNTTPGLTGTMKYVDNIRKDGSEDGVTKSSQVDVDLLGTGLNQTQMMALCKMIIFSSVVPMNSD